VRNGASRNDGGTKTSQRKSSDLRVGARGGKSVVVAGALSEWQRSTELLPPPPTNTSPDSGGGAHKQLRKGRLRGTAWLGRVNAHNAAATNRGISMPAWLQKPGMRTAFSVHITPSMHHAQQERHTTHLCAPERASRGCRSCSAQPHQHRQTQPPAGVEEHATLKGQARRQVGRAPPKQSTATHLLRLQHGLLATHATHLLRLQCGQVSIDLRRFQLPEQSVQIDVWWLRCCHHCCAAVAARLLHCAAAAAGVAAATPAHGDAVLS